MGKKRQLFNKVTNRLRRRLRYYAKKANDAQQLLDMLIAPWEPAAQWAQAAGMSQQMIAAAQQRLVVNLQQRDAVQEELNRFYTEEGAGRFPKRGFVYKLEGLNLKPRKTGKKYSKKRF